jgi:hypothetical protein
MTQDSVCHHAQPLGAGYENVLSFRASKNYAGNRDQSRDESCKIESRSSGEWSQELLPQTQELWQEVARLEEDSTIEVSVRCTVKYPHYGPKFATRTYRERSLELYHGRRRGQVG